MVAGRPTAEIDTKAELLRRAAIKRELKHELVGGDTLSAAELLAATGVDVSTPLVRQLADEIAADCDDIQRLPEHGQTPRRYRRVSEVAADD